MPLGLARLASGASMRSHPVTPDSDAPGFLSRRLGLNYDPWSRTLANTLRRLTLCPIRSPGAHSCHCRLFPRTPRNLTISGEREREREGTVDVWLCEGTGSFAFKRMSIVCFLNRRFLFFLFFRKITLSSMILFSQTNVDAKLDIII